VRELQNLVERLFTITRSDVIDLREEPGIRLMPPHLPDKPLKTAVNDFERRYIADVLERVNGSRKRAASILGIHRNTLLAKIKDLGVVPGPSTRSPSLNATG
jgi:DNA-binding NtrC family response regulator